MDDIPLANEFSKIAKDMRVVSEHTAVCADINTDYYQTLRATHRRRVTLYWRNQPQIEWP